MANHDDTPAEPTTAEPAAAPADVTPEPTQAATAPSNAAPAASDVAAAPREVEAPTAPEPAAAAPTLPTSAASGGLDVDSLFSAPPAAPVAPSVAPLLSGAPAVPPVVEPPLVAPPRTGVTIPPTAGLFSAPSAPPPPVAGAAILPPLAAPVSPSASPFAPAPVAAPSTPAPAAAPASAAAGSTSAARPTPTTPPALRASAAAFTAPAYPNVMARPVEGGATVTLTIDGQTVEVAKGTNVLEAAKLVGRDICHFCYHPGLTIAASCRQCMVEIEKNPKLVPSCQQQVADGMVVHTETERVLEARRQLLEFTLVNHPIDCPICDKAGECQLQRHYMDHDHSLTRVDVPKIRKPKVKDIGKHIVLDAERCILCSRCVRFCEEIPGTSELTMAFRGDHEQIDIAEGHRLDNPYSINVVDICPVGALTSKDFRFQIRAWELSEVPTTCNGCATGCAVSLQFKHEQAYRVLPREDADVNGHWMCDDGRFIYKELAPELRVHEARADGDVVDRRTAIALAAERLRAHRAAAVAGPSRIAAVFNAVATNEANLALAELAQLLGADRYVIGREPGEADDILRAADKNPNTAGAEAAAGPTAKHSGELALALAGGAYDAVIFVDGVGALSDVALEKLRTIDSICLADRGGPLADACTFVLPAASWAETIGSYTNRQGRLRHVQPAWRATGERRHRADLLHELMVALEHTPSYADARALSRKLAEEHGHALLLALLTEAVDARPRLLRWAHSRG